MCHLWGVHFCEVPSTIPCDRRTSEECVFKVSNSVLARNKRVSNSTHLCRTCWHVSPRARGVCQSLFLPTHSITELKSDLFQTLLSGHQTLAVCSSMKIGSSLRQVFFLRDFPSFHLEPELKTGLKFIRGVFDLWAASKCASPCMLVCVCGVSLCVQKSETRWFGSRLCRHQRYATPHNSNACF